MISKQLCFFSPWNKPPVLLRNHKFHRICLVLVFGEMADINGRRVLELVKKTGNSVCADCNCQGQLTDEYQFHLSKTTFFNNPTFFSYTVTEYASYNIGVFLCTQVWLNDISISSQHFLINESLLF
jgi:hypothetical protein